MENEFDTIQRYRTVLLLDNVDISEIDKAEVLTIINSSILP
jgi:hypothetical protein